MRQLKRFTSLLLCTSMVFTGGISISLHSSDESKAIYYISKTTTSKAKATKTTSASTSSISDPYYDKQWALNNDGTFTYQDDSNWNDGSYDSPINDILNWFNLPELFGSYSSSNSSQTNQITAVKDIDIDADKAWKVDTDQNKEVIVAVIDTGVDYTHEDLSDSIWKNSKEIAGDGIDNDKNGYIDDVYGWDFYRNRAFKLSNNKSVHEHATHVAGIIAASMNDKGIAGVAGNSKIKIMSIKALGGRYGSGDEDSVVKAIEYADEMGASICNLSFGTVEKSPDLEKVIKNSDMLFVCAAGNASNSYTGDNIDKTPVYPASYNLDNIISVANLTCDGTLDSTSNYGKTSVDIAAPGSYILSTLPQDEYGYMSGTSMATPMVSAVAAMVYSRRDVKLSKVKDIILKSAKPLTSLKDKVATGGMVNAYNAMTIDISSIK